MTNSPTDPNSHVHLNIDNFTPPGCVLNMELVRRQAIGEFRYSHTLEITDAAATQALDLVPRDYMLLHTSATDTGTAALAEGVDGLIYADVRGRRARIIALATSVHAARDLATAALSRVPRIVVSGSTQISTWTLASDRADRSKRPLAVHEWERCAVNYPPSTRHQLAGLMSLKSEPEGGRFMLWHGEPGTGKTNALRALAHSWREWCDVHVITDAPQFFAVPPYMATVLESDERGEKWLPQRRKLLVMEDADEFLAARDFAPASGAFGRLLNLTDGVLGDGTGALVLMTTNVDAATLDPALTRRGRCFASVRFSAFTPDEAREWLPDGARGPRGPVTLSELYSNGGTHL